MSSKRSSRNRPQQKMRGPSRPVDPRYAPGAPARRGPDSFAIGLIGISSALALLVIFLMMNRGNTPGTVTQPPVVQQTTAPIDAAASGTGTAIAFATGTANLPSISPEEAIALHKSGTAKFIDVRGANLYGQQHIAGAVNVPQSAIFEPSNIKEFPREGNLILYCQWPDDEESKGVAQALRDNAGYTNVRYLKHGLTAWINAGGPVEP